MIIIIIIKALKILIRQGPKALFTKIESKLRKRNQYKVYVRALERLGERGDIERGKAKAFQYRPKISVIVPVYNTDERWLRLCINSIINQTYDNWELCIADGGSIAPHVKETLKEYEEKDDRIKVKILPQNRGIAGNTNDALGLATGDFVGFLDHDDMLTPNALYEVAKAINENPHADFIYSDEIRVDSTGKVINIAFRPDFSEYYYLSHPYIVHLTVFRKKLIDKIGGLNEGDFNANISQDVDLILRVISDTAAERIVHIPKPLYKWRIVDQSAGHIYKNKVHEFTKKAIMMFLDRRAVDGYVEDGMHFNTFRVRFNLKEGKKVSIIIPTKDNYILLKEAIRSIEDKTDYKNYEVLIVANNTEDDNAKRLLSSLSEDKRYRVLEFNKPFNYSAINNFAVSHAEGEYLLFLNDDVEVINPDWLTSMVETAQDPRVGIVGAKLIYPDGRIQHAGVILGLMNGVAEHTHKFVYAYLDKKKSIFEEGYEDSLVCIREYSAVTGACMLIKRKVFEEVGGFSEDLKVGFNDIDLCLKVREKGYKILFNPYAVAFHYENASRRNNSDMLYHPEDKNIFIEKWGKIIAKGDPYYNPNLSLKSYIPIPKII